MEDLIVERRDRVLVLTLNRPHVRNAISPAMGNALSQALDDLESSPELAVAILTGRGPAFCAGMDLKAFLQPSDPNVPRRGLSRLIQNPPPKPIIAAVEGWAVAGGFEMVLACDLVIAGESAKFGVPEVKRSLVASGGAALLLPTRIPRALAMEMLFTGAPITAARAAEIGLVNHVVDDGTALDRAIAIAQTIADNGPLAIKATKLIAMRERDWSAADRWTLQRQFVDPVRESQDAREGAAAFVERRRAVWSGS